MSVKNKKADLAISELLTRQDYLVVQGNDLAKSFGGLKAFEQRVLDYCFSFVTKDSTLEQEYEVQLLDIIKHFGLSSSGDSYKRVAQAFKTLNENTALYLPTEREGVKGVRMTQLFGYIDLNTEGMAYFKIGQYAAPYVLDLKENFYSFRLHELARVHGKYALIMLKLWESNRRGKEKYTSIVGNLEDWQSWFLAQDKRLTAGRFFADVITRAIEELEANLDCDFFITTNKRGRKVIGYEIMITDTSA